MHTTLHCFAPAAPVEPDPGTRRFYVESLRALDRAGVPYLVGGGYAMAYYTGIARNTKDLDVFVRPADRDRTLTTLTAAGFKTEFFYPFWISKALHGDSFIDILHRSGNGLCCVDDAWFEHVHTLEVHGYPTRCCPAEEQLWSKAFVQDRDRFDGADVAHLILARGHLFDWARLLRRFEGHEAVLLAHVTLYEYIYPSERDRVPRWVVQQLREIVDQAPAEDQKICRGTFVAQKSYTIDVNDWGFTDGRLQPNGPLTQDEIDELPKA